MNGEFIICIGLLALYAIIFISLERRHDKEMKAMRELNEKLLDRLMARDYSEYKAFVSKDKTEVKIVEPKRPKTDDVLIPV